MFLLSDKISDNKMFLENDHYNSLFPGNSKIVINSVVAIFRAVDCY